MMIYIIMSKFLLIAFIFPVDVDNVNVVVNLMMESSLDGRSGSKS
jgi:hypothetical protein